MTKVLTSCSIFTILRDLDRIAGLLMREERRKESARENVVIIATIPEMAHKRSIASPCAHSREPRSRPMDMKGRKGGEGGRRLLESTWDTNCADQCRVFRACAAYSSIIFLYTFSDFIPLSSLLRNVQISSSININITYNTNINLRILTKICSN